METIARLNNDLEALNCQSKYDKDGNRLNPLKLDGVESADVNALADKLAYINANANTNGEYYKIGTLYGFQVLVKTEKAVDTNFVELFRENRFFVEGEGNIKHSYNNGRLANDPNLAVPNFLNALEKLPAHIEKYHSETEKLKNDIPVLQEIVDTPWRKEKELSDLKIELAALDRKIQLSLKPIDKNEDEQNEKQEVSGEEHFYKSQPISRKI